MRRNERESTDIQIIEEIIRKTDVCRIALANDNIPYIVAMNFGYTAIPERRLYFHSAKEGRKLDMIRHNNFVCFQMDTDHKLINGKEACDYSMKYSSVVGWGYLFILTGDEEKREGLDSIMQHYTDNINFSYYTKTLDKTVVLRLDIKEMSGKKG